MKILLVSDVHFALEENEKELLQQPFDACLFTGDLEYHLKSVCDLIGDIPKYGVRGNHDNNINLSDYGIADVYQQTSTFNGIPIVGFEGVCCDHKKVHGPKKCLFHEEKEYKEHINKKNQSGGILLSHCSDYKRLSNNLFYNGSKVISKYKKKYCPIIHVFGHHHLNRVYYEKGCLTICVFRFAILTINDTTKEMTVQFPFDTL